MQSRGACILWTGSFQEQAGCLRSQAFEADTMSVAHYFDTMDYGPAPESDSEAREWLKSHGRLFAVLEALDNGKPVRETRDLDVPLAARHFYYHAGWAQLQDASFPDHQPVGVVGQIIPWNFPLLMLAWKVAPALALGN